MAYHWYDFIGNIGVFLILLGYFLLQLGKLSNLSVQFNLFNIIGASLILVSLCFDFNLSAFFIEFFWLLISLIGIVRSYCKENSRTSESLEEV